MSRVFDENGSNLLTATVGVAANRTDFTFVAWVKPDAAYSGATQNAVTLDEGFNNPALRVTGGGDPSAGRYASTSADVIDFSDLVAKGAWSFLAGRTNAARADLRVNSTDFENVTAQAPITPAGASLLRIGAGDSLGHFGGKVAHVAAWTRRLSDAEIASLAGGANPLTITGSRWYYYPLTDASLTNEFTPDNSDTAGSLTVNGTVTSDTGDNPTVDAPPSSAPTISSVTPSVLTVGSSPVIVGTTFEAAQGTGTVKLSPTDNVADAGAVTQSITSWSDTEITLNGVSFPTGTAHNDTLYLFVTNDTGDSNAAGEAVTASLAPTIHTGTVVNPSAGGFSVRFTSDVDNGTAYYVVFQTTASDPSAAQIVAGTDGDGGAAVASGSMAISTTGEQTFPATTGLTQSVTYRVAVVHYGDSSA